MEAVVEIYKGKPIFKGIAIGKIFYYQKGKQQVKREKIQDVAAEIARYEAANEKASEQLQALYEKAVKEVGEANAAVFEVHMMMLEDDDYVSSITNMIETQNVNAEFAVATTGDNFAEMFSQMDDEYFKARAADVKDITERLISVLSEQESAGEIGAEPVIVVADDLAAADPLQQSLMTATAKSSGCGIRFFTLDKTIAVIHKASASQHIFLVVRNPQSARKLVEGGVPIDKLCIGNMHVGPGKEVTGDLHVYMDEKDKEDLRAIRAKGVDVYIQIAPGDHKLDFDK